MPDDTKKRSPQDAKRINLNQPYEIRYWCNKFGCTEDELRKVVRKVGDSSKAVKEEFQRRKKQRRGILKRIAIC